MPQDPISTTACSSGNPKTSNDVYNWQTALVRDSFRGIDTPIEGGYYEMRREAPLNCHRFSLTVDASFTLSKDLIQHHLKRGHCKAGYPSISGYQKLQEPKSVSINDVIENKTSKTFFITALPKPQTTLVEYFTLKQGASYPSKHKKLD